MALAVFTIGCDSTKSETDSGHIILCNVASHVLFKTRKLNLEPINLSDICVRNFIFRIVFLFLFLRYKTAALLITIVDHHC